MESLQAIRRLISNAWLAATPLVLILFIIGFFVFIDIVRRIVEYGWGIEAAEKLLINAMILAVWALALTVAGLAVYGMICLARWLLRRDEP